MESPRKGSLRYMETTRRFTESSEFGDRHERLEAIKIDLNSFLLLLDLPTEKYGNGRRVNYGRPRYVRPAAPAYLNA